MQIYSLFDAPMRSFSSGRAVSADLHIGFQSSLLPAGAGPGSICDYVFLQAGQSQRVFMARRGEWWACLRGGIRIASAGHDAVLIGCADMFAPMPGLPMQLHVALDSILVRVVPDDSAADGDASAFEDTLLQGDVSHGALGRVATMRNDSSDDLEFARGGTWAGPGVRAGFAQWPAGQCLQAGSVRWALCHRGALCLRWWQDGEIYLNFMQPGTLFVPGSHESYCLEALLPATGMLCCSGVARAEVIDASEASCLLPGASSGVLEMPRAPYGRQQECLPA